MQLMKKNNIEVISLDWDTNFFGFACAKIILHDSIDREVMLEALDQVIEYDMVVFSNMNSNIENAILISECTQAYLIDVNIQFEKEIILVDDCEDILITSQLSIQQEILNMVEFKESKFNLDPILKENKGAEVYKEWIRNSFDRKDKYFALYRDSDNTICGYLLFSINDGIGVIELIGVSDAISGNGVGSKLIKSVEAYIYKMGCSTLKVGTQIMNSNAVNFYHRNGFKQVGCHQTYHLWNR